MHCVIMISVIYFFHPYVFSQQIGQDFNCHNYAYVCYIRYQLLATQQKLNVRF